MVDALSDYDGLEDEKFAAIPPPFSPGQGDLDLDRDRDPFADGDGDGEASALAEVPAAKRRGGARRPQPKLDSSRLSSEKGLPALRTLFDDVRFKGKGHEAADLRVLMQRMENWAHRLFPKLQFEDFVERVEKLGSKKEVQTCLKRIRLDMPLTHDDFGGGEVVEEEAAAHVFGAPEPFGSFMDEPHIHSTPAPPAFSSPPAPPASSTPGAALSEEQRRRMELNRQRALERRLAARQQPAESQTEAAATAAAPEGPSHFQKEEDSATPEGPTHFQEEEEGSEPVSSFQQNQQLTSIDSEPPTVEDGSPAPSPAPSAE